MKLLEISGFLPDTANSLEHASVVELKELIDDVAKTRNTAVSKFEVSGGVVVVAFGDEKALEHLAAEFREMEDVKTSQITYAAFQRKRNIAAQEKINKMRAKKKEKKEQEK